MKIMFVISQMSFGGAERVMANLINKFSGEKHEVSLVCAYDYPSAYPLDPNVKLYYSARHEGRKNHFFRMTGFIADLRLFIRKLRPDIVISFLADINVMVIPACRLEKVPVIVSERNDPKNSPQDKIRRILRTLTYPLADGFVFQTNDARNYFPKKIRKRSAVIPNPLMVKIPEPCEKKPDKFVAVGRLEKQKNHLLLIRAFEKVVRRAPDARLYIYGSGSLQETLQEEINRRNLSENIYLMGNRPDVLDQIRDARGFILSSDFEGMPNALMEAMACGVACISTDCPCGGSRMLIRDGVNGLLTQTGNADQLAEAVWKLIADPDLCKKLGENAVEVRKIYHVDRIHKMWTSYIQSLLHKKQPLVHAGQKIADKP